MAKTEKELAFLRDLYIDGEWTQRFTDLVDKHLRFPTDDENFLYINAGTGNHCFAIRDKVGKETAVFASCENEHLVSIARDKAIALRSDVDLSTLRFEDDSFDSVLADASLSRPADLEETVANAVRVAKSGGRVSVFFPVAGSFGEVFSLLWEVLFNEDLGEHGAAAEAMITELPTQTRAEQIASDAGLGNVESFVANEIFEYDDAAAFLASPLIADFLLPRWTATLNEADKNRVAERLGSLIDAEDGSLSFRFTVKAAMLTGRKLG
jgi:SAM-dependent methyltransferase